MGMCWQQHLSFGRLAIIACAYCFELLGTAGNCDCETRPRAYLCMRGLHLHKIVYAFAFLAKTFRSVEWAATIWFEQIDVSASS
mmetsp:Transcript_7198/g.12125  ORF Transcript_7198/g.12125 Transcript_7198/m.12125 type:complete len:84 (-) Transcript_7198:23-274(-)